MKALSMMVMLLFVLFTAGAAAADEPAELPAVEEYELGDIDYYELKIPTAGPAKKKFYENIMRSKECPSDNVNFPFQPPSGSKYDPHDPKSCYNKGVGLLKGDFDNIVVPISSNIITAKADMINLAQFSSSTLESIRMDWAYAYFKTSANQNFAPALYAIGLMLYNGYEPGNGVEGEYGKPVDYNERAFKYLQMAADMGFEKAAPLFAELQAEKEAVATSEAEQRLRVEEAKRLQAERDAQAKRLQAERDRQVREAQAATAATEAAEKQRLQVEEESARAAAAQRAAAAAAQRAAEKESARTAAAQRAAAEEALYSKLLKDHQREIIDIVRESWLAAYPEAENYPPVGEVFERSFDNPSWEFHAGTGRIWRVIFTGIGRPYGQNARIRLVFDGQPMTEEQLREKKLVFALVGLFVNDENSNYDLNDFLADIYLN